MQGYKLEVVTTVIHLGGKRGFVVQGVGLCSEQTTLFSSPRCIVSTPSYTRYELYTISESLNGTQSTNCTRFTGHTIQILPISAG